MASKGIVAVTVNYRLNVFGFLAHPELTKESPHHASGNYGLLDQSAALRWVRQNIAAFGGDPEKITIAGESAGSISVTAQMASPLSKDLIAGAIGESGSPMGTLTPVPLAEAEQVGVRFANKLGAKIPGRPPQDPGQAVARSHGRGGRRSLPARHRRLFSPQESRRDLRRRRAGPRALCWSVGTPRSRTIGRSWGATSRRRRIMPKPCRGCTATEPGRS